MDVAKGPEQSVDSLVQRILALNFASAHTTSMVSRQVFRPSKLQEMTEIP